MQNYNSLKFVCGIAALVIPGCLCGADLAPIHRKGPLASSGGPLSGPVLGYVAQDSPLELRAILGVPGSAVFSDPLPLPKNASRLYLAPDQSYALVERPAADPALLPLGASQVVAATLTGVIQTANFVAFSPRGQSAVLYSAARSRLQVIAGLPDAPQLARDLDTTTFLEQPVDGAISDDATRLLLTSPNEVYQLLPSGLLQPLLSVGGAAALAFLPNSSQAAIADRGSGSAYLWSTGVPSLLVGGLAAVGEMRPASDGLSLWLTDPAGNNISSLGLKTAELRTFKVPVSPLKLQGLAVRDMFLLASDPGQPAWILFQQGGEALATFVPAAQRKKIAFPTLGGVQ
jgi:hypothetical protein